MINKKLLEIKTPLMKKDSVITTVSKREKICEILLSCDFFLLNLAYL